MLPKNLKDLKSKLGELIDRDVDNSSSFLTENINTAIRHICNVIRFEFLKRTIFLQTTAEYTTGTVAVSNGSTSVTGTDTAFDDNMITQLIALDGQVYEVSDVSSTTALTLDRPFEGTTITADATSIIYANMKLPHGWEPQRISVLRDTSNQVRLLPMTHDRWTQAYPNPVDTGHPRVWVPLGKKTGRLPESGAGELDTGSGTTSVIIPADTAKLATVDDFYNDWFCVNQTRESVSRVTDYVTATRVATTTPAVTGQVATDVAYLFKEIFYIRPYPMTTEAISLHMTGYILPDNLVNNYDVPQYIPPQWHDAIYYRAAIESQLILDDSRIRKIEALYGSILGDMIAEYGTFEEENYKKQAIDEDLESHYLPYTYPLG